MSIEEFASGIPRPRKDGAQRRHLLPRETGGVLGSLTLKLHGVEAERGQIVEDAVPQPMQVVAFSSCIASAESSSVCICARIAAIRRICQVLLNTILRSSYNERRAQCELGVRLLRELVTGIRSLRDVTIVQYEQWKDGWADVIARRCRHVITKNDRTLRAAAALSENNTEEFGKLMCHY
jgi:hypothetical protein